MPSERFVEALNEQIGREFRAAHQYTAVAAYYDRLTYPRLAKFFYDQAEEERGHALKMVGYLRDTGADLSLGEVPAPSSAATSPVPPSCAGAAARTCEGSAARRGGGAAAPVPRECRARARRARLRCAGRSSRGSGVSSGSTSRRA